METSKDPIDYIIIDNFLDENVAEAISNEFIDYDDPRWFVYDSPLENKKACNDWNIFPSETYDTLTQLNSDGFIDFIKQATGISTNLLPDIGLHGGGWHIHGTGGKLNIHLDYSIHPKLHLQRKLNLIIYLTKDWDSRWGGNLEFWSHDPETNRPKERRAVVENVFNRAVLFDTTQNSWHGFPEEITCPKGVYRKSLAVYYLTDPAMDADKRTRALYAPYKDQITDKNILDLIKQRAS